MKKINWKKHKLLPEYRVFMIRYSDKGKILNISEILETEENYFIEKVIKAGRTEGENWVEYMCEKRDKPKSAGII